MALTLPAAMRVPACLGLLFSSLSWLSPPCAGWSPVAKVGYQTDSENLISAWAAEAGVAGIKGALGAFDLSAAYGRNGVASNRFGLGEFSTETIGLLGSYRAALGPYGLVANGGLGSLDGWKDYTLGGEASRYWVVSDGLVLRAKGTADSRVNKDNPFLAALNMRALSTMGSLILTYDTWYLESAAGARFIGGASNGAVDALLADNTQVEGIPANRIATGYLYGYRRMLDFLTLGAFASWSDSRRDFYRFLQHQGKVDNYMYFPYDTPRDAISAGGILGLDFDWDNGEVPMGAWSAKVTFPFYSSRNQSYEIRSPNGIPMWPGGSYTFKGSEPWSAELKVKKTVGEKTSVTLAYRFFLKPYLEYGFFDDQSYRMHAVEIRVGG